MMLDVNSSRRLRQLVLGVSRVTRRISRAGPAERHLCLDWRGRGMKHVARARAAP